MPTHISPVLNVSTEGGGLEDGRYARAEPLFRQALDLVVQEPGTATEEIRAGLGHFPAMLRKMKRKSEAQELQAPFKTLLSK